MAWTDITNTFIAVGKAVRARDIRALRDNIAALAAGEAGAPRITGAAMKRPSAGGVLCFRRHGVDIEVISPADSYPNTPGNLIGNFTLLRGTAGRSGFMFTRAGSYRVQFELSRNPSSDTGAVAQVVQNTTGNILAEFENPGFDWITCAVDVVCEPSDVVLVLYRPLPGISPLARIRNLVILADDEYPSVAI
jgi:hypothetical protein